MILEYPLNISKYDLDVLVSVNENNFISLNIVMILKEFAIAMEIDNNEDPNNKAINVNRNIEIYDGLRKYLSKLSLVRITFSAFYNMNHKKPNYFSFI